MERTILQNQVIEAARKQLKLAGVDEVCINELPDDSTINKVGFDEAVSYLYGDSLYYAGVLTEQY